MTWLLPELDAGVDDGELSPDDELPDVLELADLLDELGELGEPELEPELPVPDVAWCVPVAAEPEEECDAAVAAPGRLNATAPAATRLAAAAETVTVRSRLLPRSRSATPARPRCATSGGVSRGGMLCLLMPASLAARFPQVL